MPARIHQALVTATRIVVIGSSCAGKSTFAQQLAAARGCACIELDELFWSRDWTPRPLAEFRSSVAQAAAGDAWVAAGNYSSARDLLWPRATTIVWLNYSLPVVLWRGLRRTIRRAALGEVLFHGNRESFRRSFLSKESILWWIVSTYHRRRRNFEALRASGEYGHLQWVEAQDPAAAAEILRSLGLAESCDASPQQQAA
jgi:adenylate kinase family enzyme